MVKASRTYPEPQDAILSVVIPAYNVEQWIKPTLTYLAASIKKTVWKKIEIIVVDDGSSDNTANVAKNVDIGLKIRVIRQNNCGRLKTRKNGVAHAKGDYVFFLDSRVFTHAGSFEYLVEQMCSNSKAVVWNGHIEVERTSNPYARFWYAITAIAWRRYLANPVLTHYNLDDFDYYPKGAGCFFAPRDYFIYAYKNFETTYKEDRYANDDTSLIRIIASKADIYISPSFSFTYNSRSTFKAFIKHSLHRGIVLIDGYLHRGTRYFWPLIIYLTILPVAIGLIFLNPLLILSIPVLLVFICLTLLALKLEARDALSLVAIGPIFAIYYTFGMYKGIWMRLAKR